MSGLFEKAERKLAKLKILVDGPSGSGKTFSSLRLMRGIVGPKGKFAVIDTENKKSSLYGNKFDFDVAGMNPPYLPEKYVKAINAAVEAGYDGLIVDGISQEWQACLDEQAKIPGNSYTAWKMISPRHDAFIQAVLNSNIHIICTARSKQDYQLEDKDGKKIPVKMGLAPIQRDGVDYEFDVQFSVGIDHVARVPKDRLEIFQSDSYLQLTEEVGERLSQELNS